MNAEVFFSYLSIDCLRFSNKILMIFSASDRSEITVKNDRDVKTGCENLLSHRKSIKNKPLRAGQFVQFFYITFATHRPDDYY